MQTATGWKIDFKKLSKLASGHKKFIADVRRCWKENEKHGWLIGIKVFTREKDAGAESCHRWIAVGFRTAKSISYLACYSTYFPQTLTNYQMSSMEAHYSEDYVAQMAEML